MSIFRPLSGASQREPGPLSPVVVPLADLQVLGELKGRRWVKHRGAEYELTGRPLPDRSLTTRLADGHFYVADSADDGELIYWATVARAAGSFAAGGRLPAAEKAKPVKPSRRVDALDGIPLLDARSDRWTTIAGARDPDLLPLTLEAREVLNDPAIASSAVARRMVGTADFAHYTEGKPKARGAEAIRQRLARAKVGTVGDGPNMVFVAPRGAVALELRPILRLVAPILRGDPCSWCSTPAWTVVEPGLPACEMHASEELEQ
jgi:hypothetical protein